MAVLYIKGAHIRELLEQYLTHSKCFFEFSYFYLWGFISYFGHLSQHLHGFSGYQATTTPWSQHFHSRVTRNNEQVTVIPSLYNSQRRSS